MLTEWFSDSLFKDTVYSEIESLKLPLYLHDFLSEMQFIGQVEISPRCIAL